MSRKRYEHCSYQPSVYSGCGCGNGANGSIGLVGIVILILIILQFKKGDYHKDYECKEDYDYDSYEDKSEVDYEEYEDCEEEHEVEYKGKYESGIDNGILFIIALFYLACCSKKWC